MQALGGLAPRSETVLERERQSHGRGRTQEILRAPAPVVKPGLASCGPGAYRYFFLEETCPRTAPSGKSPVWMFQ